MRSRHACHLNLYKTWIKTLCGCSKPLTACEQALSPALFYSNISLNPCYRHETRCSKVWKCQNYGCPYPLCLSCFCLCIMIHTSLLFLWQDLSSVFIYYFIKYFIFFCCLALPNRLYTLLTATAGCTHAIVLPKLLPHLLSFLASQLPTATLIQPKSQFATLN